MRNKSKSPRLCFFAWSVVSLTAVLSGAGCGTDRLPDYVSKAPATTASSVRTGRESGMEITLDPFVEAQRTKQFFGINAAADGVGIVFARIANHTTNQTFLVQKANFQLVRAGAASGQNADTKTVERNGTSSTVVGTVGAVMLVTGGIGGALLILSSASSNAHATETQRNFVSKEMPDQTLAPGENMEGFIYYTPVPKAGSWARGATMKINLPDTKSHETVSMIVPLSE